MASGSSGAVQTPYEGIVLAGPTLVHPVKRVGIDVHDQRRENTWVFSEGTDKLNFTAFSIHNVLGIFFMIVQKGRRVPLCRGSGVT